MKCERKHLLGQDTMPKGRRNRGLTPVSLSRRTLIKSISNAWSRLRATIMKDCLGGGSQRAFTRVLQNFATSQKRTAANSMSFRRKATRVRSTIGKTNRKSAYGQFRKAKWDPAIKVKSPQFASEQRRIAELWDALPRESMAEWQAAAEDENIKIEAAELKHKRAQDDLSVAGDVHSYGYRAAKRQAVANSVKSYMNHPAWKSGLGLQCPSSGLDPSMIDMVTTQERVRGLVADGLKYDEVGLQNPKGRHQPELTCHELAGGLCTKYPLSRACNVLTHNLHHALTERGLKRDQYPILIQLGAVNSKEFHMVSDASFDQLLVFASMELDEDRKHALLLTRPSSSPNKPSMVFQTSQSGFKRALTVHGEFSGRFPTDLR